VRGDLVVLCGHLPGEQPQRFDRYEVTSFLYDDGEPPEKGTVLGRWWATNKTIISLDNDVEVRDEHLDTLLACPSPLCSWQFELHYASGAPGNHLIQEDEGDGFAGYSPMGLVKVTPQARRLWQMPYHWRDVEMAMCACVTTRWHLHGPANAEPPLIHHHW
jgi:hypothetical protein